ncbi:MAG: sugar ABC transporter ATP-binding protein [Devosia sp.]|uniref:ATP-binding cassette domain-containing protein n=1 Tax=Devosia sp. TaxID=1871048 RepID=UPI001A3962A4|nr:ATP-binding cassette domain-containing protein [Devosia sp.]MBL8598626.1 sugar ABC transporter ATP-binding protein [Devosia sp.]
MNTAEAKPAVLELRGLSKSFGPVHAVKSVSLSIYPGEVIGLVGDNGAGKSTLTRMMAGTIRPDTGDIVVAGEKQTFESAQDARRAGVETVFQTLALVPGLDIVENIFLGRELLASGPLGAVTRTMDVAAMRRRVQEGYERFGLGLPDIRTKVAGLSGGQRQVVAIARAVLWGSRIVVLDEPTAALGVKQTELVLSFIEQLRSHNVAVVFISHNMQHVMRVADRVCVLRLGRRVFDGQMSALTGTDLVALMTGAATAVEQVAAAG